MWKGVLRLGDVSVPVKFYSAVEDRDVHFRLLHAADGVPVEQRMVDPATGDVVPREAIRRGVEVEDDVFVMLSEEELEELDPGDGREIEIERFVPASDVDPRWYDRPYWLGPDGSTGRYAALAEALEASGRAGVARWVMRKKRYRGALGARDGHLLMLTLRSAQQVVVASDLEAPEGREAEPQEVELAEKLVAALEAPFDPERFENEHRQRVVELIAAKARGEAIEFAEAREPRREEASLADALAESLRSAGEAA